ncbi:hypothetical protein BC830DRAFT_1093344 [Chytriomyces sp. MP71]|nr:hypothetical protein BC830DRAFT_1093344 [Chytriomyces sp. MP71]
MVVQGRRLFSSTARVFGRRRAGPAADGGRRDGDDAIPGLTGRWATDGLHRYEFDLIETVAWTRGILEDMAAPLAASTSHATASARTFDPAKTGLAVAETRRFTYALDQRVPPQPLTLHVRVSSLELLPSVRHRFLALAAPFYDGADVVVLESDAGDGKGLSQAARKLELLKRLDALLKEAAKESPALAANVPIDLRHVKKPKRDLTFPEHWKQPPAAPKAA